MSANWNLPPGVTPADIERTNANEEDFCEHDNYAGDCEICDEELAQYIADEMYTRRKEEGC